MSAPPPPVKPTMYCRKCWYILDGLDKPRCPECGRPFDPDDGRTYRHRPPLTWRQRLDRLLTILFILGAIAIIVYGLWIYRYNISQRQLHANARLWHATLGSDLTCPKWLVPSLQMIGLPTPERISSFKSLDNVMTDERMALITQVPSIRSVQVSGPMTDLSLRHLARLKNLLGLEFSSSEITDAGLEKFIPTTTCLFLSLNLSGSEISDKGLEVFKKRNILDSLRISNTAVTDAGLAHLKSNSMLVRLDISKTQVTDEGLAHLKGLTRLQVVNLSGTQITDAGLIHLKQLPALGYLYITKTQITADGVAMLQQNKPTLYANSSDMSND